MEELRPCPFCGSTDLACEYDYVWNAVVRCRTCKAVGPQVEMKPRGTRTELIKAWNGGLKEDAES